VSLPEITHLQFSVLAFLRSDEQPGKAVREQLAGLGLKRSGPAFYQLMARLEDAELVDGRYDQKIVEGLQHPGQKRENHLFWAAPGSGKTYFVQRVTSTLPDTVDSNSCLQPRLTLRSPKDPFGLFLPRKLVGTGEDGRCQRCRVRK